VFTVASMTVDLTEFVYFDFMYIFDFYSHFIFSNYVNMLRK